jgi:hypothetical protein
MDNDSQMLRLLGNALIDLQIRYRAAPLADRMAMKHSLDQLLMDYAHYQIRLMKEGTITTEDDLREMAAIRAEVEQAAATQQVVVALAKTIAFVATKV